jgi:hypothetical protein
MAILEKVLALIKVKGNKDTPIQDPFYKKEGLFVNGKW